MYFAGYDEDQSRAIFLAADTDGSGLIELSEFLAWYKNEALKNRDGKAQGFVLAMHRESSGVDDAALVRDQLRFADNVASPALMRQVPGSPRLPRMRSRIPSLRAAGSSLHADFSLLPARLVGRNSSSIKDMKARASAYGSGAFSKVV